MELNIKIDNNPLIKFKIKEWDNFVELISFEVWKALIKRRWDYAHIDDYSIFHLPLMESTKDGHKWTLDELRNEVYEVIDQLVKVEKYD